MKTIQMIFMALTTTSSIVITNGLRDAKDTKSLRHMIVGIIPFLPYSEVNLNRDGKIIAARGFVPNMVEWLSEKYHFTYEYVEPPDGGYGVIVNGSWNGLIGMVYRGEIDMAGADLSITYERSSVVDFTYAFINDPSAFLVPYPQLASTISGVIRPFQYLVWIGIIVSLISTAFVLWSIRRIESFTVYVIRKSHSISSDIWLLFRVFANADEIANLTPSTQVLVAGWCLATFVLVQSYTSCLVSNLTAPRFIPLINTLEELANSHDITLVMLKYTSTASFLSAATSGSYGKLGSKLRAHPEQMLVEAFDNIEDIVATERNKVASMAESVVKMTAYNDFKKTNQCRLAIAKGYLYDDRCGFALAKSTPLIDKFNKDLIWLQETGLLNHWINSHLPKPYRCSAHLSSLRPPTAKKKLTLNFLSSAFILYVAGVAFSVYIFVNEVVLRKCLDLIKKPR